MVRMNRTRTPIIMAATSGSPSKALMAATMTAMKKPSESRAATRPIRPMSTDWPMSGQMRERTRAQTSLGVAMRPSTERETVMMSRPVRMVETSDRTREGPSWARLATPVIWNVSRAVSVLSVDVPLPGSADRASSWARVARKVTAAESSPTMLMTIRAGRNMARGLARSASNAPLMISVTPSGRRGMIPGLGARAKGFCMRSGPAGP